MADIFSYKNTQLVTLVLSNIELTEKNQYEQLSEVIQNQKTLSHLVLSNNIQHNKNKITPEFAQIIQESLQNSIIS